MNEPGEGAFTSKTLSEEGYYSFSNDFPVIKPWPGGEVRDNAPIPSRITCWELFPIC